MVCHMIPVMIVRHKLEKGENKMEEYSYTQCECPICGRKILVERILVGVSHTTVIYATCLDCVVKRGFMLGYEEEHPDAVKDLTEWHNSSTQSVKEEE